MDPATEPNCSSEHLSVAAFDAIPANIAIVDHRGRIVLVNRAWREFAAANGLPDPAYCVGSNYLAACRLDADAPVAEEHPAAAGIRAVLEARLTVFEFEYPCHSPEEKRHFLLRCALVHGANPPQAVIAHVNITARVLAEESLRKAREQTQLQQEQLTHLARLSTMGQMASGMAHELNQPLAAIVNYAAACRSLLERTDPPLDTVREGFRQLADESLRAGEILRRMRAFARRQSPQRVPVDVGAVISAAVAHSAAGIERHGIALQRNVPDRLPPALGDPVLVEQVLVNLLRNAIDALAETGDTPRSIVISAGALPAGMVEVSIRDSGPGVPAELFPRLFEPFFTTKPAGLGMGLNLSRTIIEDQNGRLTASREPQGGMRFTLTLPTAQTEAAPR